MNHEKWEDYTNRKSAFFTILKRKVHVDGGTTRVLMGKPSLRKQISEDEGLWAYEIFGGELLILDRHILADVNLKKPVTMMEYLRGDIGG